MSIKRVISTVLLVVMCAALLTGCAGNDLAPGEPFSFWQKMEVNRVAKGKLTFIDEGGKWMYFGVYDGAMVIYSDGATMVMTYVSLGGYSFDFPTGATPVVIYQGKHYGFEEAYKEGILTREAIGQIHAYFTSDQYREDRYGRK
ncbi:MAG: hypothetical protein E7461_03775 [Ruminococcaceae bacterium]|nr:hypothetical protein [Oscillospiraceae bacterium]